MFPDALSSIWKRADTIRGRSSAYARRHRFAQPQTSGNGEGSRRTNNSWSVDLQAARLYSVPHPILAIYIHFLEGTYQ